MTSILVIDDNEPLANGLAELFRLSGHEAQAASGGTSALDLAAGRTYDVVLSDIHMSPLDGIETVRLLRQLMPDAKYVFMTGFATKQELATAATLSGADVILKPFSPRALLEALEAWQHGNMEGCTGRPRQALVVT